MKYHLYFHNDFDGMASSAVMLNFLRSRGDDIISFNPIDYTPILYKNWVSFKFLKPFILVDFRYHMAASWWFDHHETSFQKPALSNWQKSYKNDSTHCSDAKFESCCSLVLACLKTFHNYKSPRHIVELAKWLDIIDGANYKSIRETIESSRPALKLRTYLFGKQNKNQVIKFLHNLAFEPIGKIAARQDVLAMVEKIDAKIRKTLERLPQFSVVSERTVFIDATKMLSNLSHYMAYYCYPHIKYSVVLEKENGFYHLGVGFNRWQSEKHCINIGMLMVKYGGGGHKTVGAVEKKSKSEILKIAQEIIKYLNKHG